MRYSFYAVNLFIHQWNSSTMGARDFLFSFMELSTQGYTENKVMRLVCNANAFWIITGSTCNRHLSTLTYHSILLCSKCTYTVRVTRHLKSWKTPLWTEVLWKKVMSRCKTERRNTVGTIYKSTINKHAVCSLLIEDQRNIFSPRLLVFLRIFNGKDVDCAMIAWHT